MIIDAENLILGRLASFVAKRALENEEVIIVNSEKVVISGKKSEIINRYKEKFEGIGNPLKGPYFAKTPDKFLRRVIRGMIPRKKPHGKEAFKRVMCYIGIPEEYRNQKFETVKEAQASKLKISYIKLADLIKELK